MLGECLVLAAAMLKPALGPVLLVWAAALSSMKPTLPGQPPPCTEGTEQSCPEVWAPHDGAALYETAFQMAASMGTGLCRRHFCVPGSGPAQQRCRNIYSLITPRGKQLEGKSRGLGQRWALV